MQQRRAEVFTRSAAFEEANCYLVVNFPIRGICGAG
jgi:hypothetical protein